MDALKVSNAATKVIAVLSEEPLSPHEMYAALVSAANTVHQTVEAHNKASVFVQVLAKLRGAK